MQRLRLWQRLLILALVLAPLAGCFQSKTTAVANEGFAVFKVEPSDAEVYIDGQLEGKARQFNGLNGVLRLESGSHKLEIRKEGYQSYHKELYAGAGAKQTIHAKLRPLAEGGQ